ncbi:hypothetical protein SRB5_42700 [Streptomyces sp. RB5]|uniref:Uncharacterized protein n=1 Tax=Streptomyces smaragdinus TaxID=2585196 RepID=A0A7K0CKT5_9ACTN|nr:hypothetical protein [Streptomyces smaragdinus]
MIAGGCGLLSGAHGGGTGMPAAKGEPMSVVVKREFELTTLGGLLAGVGDSLPVKAR